MDPKLPHDSKMNYRSSWAKLDWSEAQKKIGDLLSSHGYHEFQEYRLPNHKRADIIIWKQTQHELRFGILEVKSYKTITPSIQIKALEQVTYYYKLFYQSLLEKPLWNRQNLRFFIAVIFSKDYPAFTQIIHNFNIKENLENIPLPDILICTPERLILELSKKGFIDPSQQELQQYFTYYS